MEDRAGKAGALPRVMMIDDEVSNLQIVKIILMRENFNSELLFYEDGKSALDYLASNWVDLILLDLAMPAMDGFEVMERLKENPDTADIPVVFLSAYHDTEHILRAFELGATDFLGKPIISPILTARIRTILHARGLQKELKQSNEELVNTNRLKDELLSICSHDLRSPLSSIELICQFLHDALEGKTKESKPDLINRIVSQSRVARRLVENLLDLNRIEEGRLVPTPSFFPVAELVEKCLEDEGPNLQAKGIRHTLQKPKEDWLCFGDREMIAQVLHNLLNNAAKHAESHIGIDWAVGAAGGDSGGKLALAITDDGPGIPESHRQSVFEKYGKVDHQSGGSGLGLYISRQMMEMHNGNIRVRPGLKGGAAFSLELPNIFLPDQLPLLAEHHPSRVLIVSASKILADLLEGVLLEAGLVHVEPAIHRSFLETALEGEPPDLVVVDVHSAPLATLLKEWASAGSPDAGWLLYGQEEAMETFGQSLSQPFTPIASPLNPLLYLRGIAQLLEKKGNSSRLSTV